MVELRSTVQMRTSVPYVGRCDLQLLSQSNSHLLLMSKIQFGAGTRDMEHVGCGLTLGVDDRNLDIAAEFGHGGTDVVKQPGTVLGNDLDQRAVLGAAVVDLHAGLDGYFRTLQSPSEFRLHEFHNIAFTRYGFREVSLP